MHPMAFAAANQVLSSVVDVDCWLIPAVALDVEGVASEAALVGVACQIEGSSSAGAIVILIDVVAAVAGAVEMDMETVRTAFAFAGSTSHCGFEAAVNTSEQHLGDGSVRMSQRQGNWIAACDIQDIAVGAAACGRWPSE